MSIINHKSYRGDTLIEVLLAITVFSLVAVGAMATMSSGTSTIQRSLEISLVRNEIDAQAETLRFLNASYIANYPNTIAVGTPEAEWVKIRSKTSTNVTLSSSCPTTIPQNSFILDTRYAKFYDTKYNSMPQTFSQVRYNPDTSVVGPINNADGIWIQLTKSTTVASNYQSNTGYIDFYIRACWNGPGQKVPVTLQTIVRLYEPR